MARSQARSPPTPGRSSPSPPDSPSVATPTHTSFVMSLNIEKDSGILESSLPVDDTKGEVDHDRNDRPLSTPSPHPPSSNSKSSASPLVQSAPHFVARATSGQRTESSGPFTSSAQPTSTTLRAGAPRHGHGHENGERGFLEGTPQAIARQDYVGADKKKEPEYASPFEKREAREARYPLSSATNGSAAHKSTTAPEPKRFYDSVPYWLALYFCFNLGLTLFNKIVLVSFPFPYTLTGLHALSGCAGTYIALERGAFVPARLTQKENLILGAFSVLYTINIAVSNISLQLVTVPFHQVVRAATPLFTIFITAAFLRVKFSMRKLVSLLPVVAGVGFATYGDYYFTAWGLVLTLLGTFLAALKTVVTNVIQTGGGGRLKLHPLDLLMRMSPLAFVQCVFYGWYTGELERVRRYGATQMTTGKAIALFVNGIIACGLNIVSFTANKKAGPLTMTVSANCKQVLTIALAVILFNLHISITNGIGIFLTLCGGALYAYVEFTEKRKKQLSASTPKP